MRRKHYLQLLVAVIVVAPALAHAQAREPRVWIGGGFGISPSGTLKTTVNGMSSSEDASTAVSVTGIVEFHVAPNVAIGFVPTVLFNIKSGSDSDSSNALDLPLRISVGGRVAPAVRIYGFASPGYSILFPPDAGAVDLGHPSGFMLGFGGGAGFRVAPGVQVTTELGYQFRWLSATGTSTFGPVDVSVDYDARVNYLTFAVGLLARI